MKKEKTDFTDDEKVEYQMRKHLPLGFYLDDYGKMALFNNHLEAIPIDGEYCIRIKPYPKEILNAVQVANFDLISGSVDKHILLGGKQYMLYNEDHAPWVSETDFIIYCVRLKSLGLHWGFKKDYSVVFSFNELPEDDMLKVYM